MNPIVLALDSADLTVAEEMLSKVHNHIGMIKIGTELWASHGPEALRLGNDFNLPIFLDLKLHDIPNTVAKTVDVIANKHAIKHDIRFLSVHTFGAKEMLKRAVEAAKNSPVKIAAVTILTSLNERDLGWLGFTDRRINIQTADRAEQAKKLNVDTFICSAQNSNLLRKRLDDDSSSPAFKATIISPGIRLNNVEDDQKRTSTVAEAIRNGTDYLVVGRPITTAEDPEQAAKMFSDLALKYIR